MLFLTALLSVTPALAAGSVYDYLNTSANLAGAKHAYMTGALADPLRAKIVATAKEECGGRYEGVEVAAFEISHSIEVDKQVIHTPNPVNYSLKYTGTTDAKWLVIEAIKCSIHEGHARATLGARYITGKETVDVTYKYVNDNQVGAPVAGPANRSYAPGAKQLESEYQTPYGTKVTL